MKFLKPLMVGAALLAVAACETTDRIPSHPHYGAAIDDLRIARGILDRESEYAIVRGQYRALEAIDRSILEMKHAAVEAAQDVAPPPIPDPALDYPGRLHRARELVMAAGHELSFREDDPAAREYRENAGHYVNEALEAIDTAIHDRRVAEMRP